MLSDSIFLARRDPQPLIRAERQCKTVITTLAKSTGGQKMRLAKYKRGLLRGARSQLLRNASSSNPRNLNWCDGSWTVEKATMKQDLLPLSSYLIKSSSQMLRDPNEQPIVACRRKNNNGTLEISACPPEKCIHVQEECLQFFFLQRKIAEMSWLSAQVAPGNLQWNVPCPS